MKMKALQSAGLAVWLAAGISAIPVEASGKASGSVNGHAELTALAKYTEEAQATASSALPSDGVDAATIKEIHIQQADESYVPLFGSRQEDKPAITKAAELLKRLLAKSAPTTKRLEGAQHFFATSVNVKLADGRVLSLEFMNQQDILLYYGADVYLATDKEALSKLQELMVLPQRTTFSTVKPAIGDTIAVKGSNGYGQQGMVNVFVETPGPSGGYSTSKGAYFPSKRALLVYSAPMSEARYDFDFVLPAYGEAIDGAFKPIKPGAYSLVLITDSSSTSFGVTVSAPSIPQLAINGVPVNGTNLQPIMKNGVMLLPMRALAEAFGWNVTWDPAHKAAMIASGNAVPAVNPGSGSALSLWINGKQLTGVNAQPVIVKGSVYLPLRATAQALGFQLTWTPNINGALLSFRPALLKERDYAGDARKLAAINLVNNYVNALNARDSAALDKLFVKDSLPAPAFYAIGQRLITGIRSVYFQDRPGGALLANVTFTYLFDANGNRAGSKGIVLMQENGAWRIADVD